MKITRKFIAERAGVSPTAVSDVINGNPKARIGDEARARIMEAVRKHNYVPNPTARSLVMQKTFNIGLMYKAPIVDFISDPFSHELFLGIASEIEKNDYLLSFSILKDSEELNPSSRRMIYGNCVDGLVFVGDIRLSVLDALIERNIPFSVVDFIDSERRMNTVLPDNFNGAKEAVDYLIAERKCETVVCLNSKIYPQHPSYTERPAGYIDSMNGNALEPRVILTKPDIDSAFHTVLAYLEAGKTPDAFFCTGDHMAIGCMRALKEFRPALLEEVSIIGFDNIRWLQNEDPMISSVDVPKEEMGREAIRLLLDSIDEPGSPKRVLRLPTQLKLRQT